MDTAKEVKSAEDTSKSIQVDNHVILTVDKDGTVMYPAPISGKDLYDVIDRGERRITKLMSEDKKDEAHRETLHLFMAVTLYEIGRLRAALDELKVCKAT